MIKSSNKNLYVIHGTYIINHKQTDESVVNGTTLWGFIPSNICYQSNCPSIKVKLVFFGSAIQIAALKCLFMPLHVNDIAQGSYTCDDL